MIDLDTLRGIRTIVAHEDCADGRLAALIPLDVLRDAEVVFLTYNTPEHRRLAPAPGMIFVDFTPWVARHAAGPFEGQITSDGWAHVHRFVEAGVCVLDHHRGAREIVDAFGDRGVFTDVKGESGAWLAFREVWEVLVEERDEDRRVLRELADLVGIRDTWQRYHPRWEEACAVSSALKFIPWMTLLTMLRIDGWGSLLRMLETIGPHVRAHDLERARGLFAGAVPHHLLPGEDWSKLALFFEGGSGDTSNVADIAPIEIDLVAGWHYTAERQHGAVFPRLKVSLRTRRPGFDVSEIARKLGGNGHPGAAGFVVDVDACASPHAQIRRELERVLATTGAAS